ncbi:dual specificity protein phosphatase 16 [Syngnathoides biaculeatus]|uniref:dual specificity protein phosphatase 16 n=1 Tax=Syngnathoides biaculeatus TaxID=300417 RepID=UPI002ADDED95|nr:dual specificity protein phosphatase 16 [Syngnathoides biaculeatus]
MVWSREGEKEGPPLSIILPRLYLGAESDVTQDRLASLGISYVLSVSRCSPRPTFLPCSRYLRIPIDDSLWDDLLPWIPQALHFIDSAMSSGASVLVHCAAGISRSPALAVAYIMYSSGMDLDHAYRFVKERRPSISPNFNFLGQLQHFQHQKAASDHLERQELDNSLPSINKSNNHTPMNPNTNHQTNVTCDNLGEEMQTHRKNFYQHRHSTPDANGNQEISLSGNLWTHMNNQEEIQTPNPSFCVSFKPSPKPSKLHLPSVSASLSERRKSLSLSLTPMGICPPSTTSNNKQAKCTDLSVGVHKRETAEKMEEKALFRHTGETHMEQSPSSEKHNTSQVKEQGLLSPLSCTLNKLLHWGERVLLGGVFAHPVKMGQPALPYRC